jgi:hypothetical protein
MALPRSAPTTAIEARRASHAASAIVAAAALLGAALVFGAAALWFYYGTAVFFDMVSSGIAACF